VSAAVIAARRLRSALGEILVELCAPQAEGEDMRCAYRITGPRLSVASHAMGVDGFQAMDLALRKIGIELRMSEEFVAGPIRWLDRDEPGFLLPESCAELGWSRP
jgi:hypothetical protein